MEPSVASMEVLLESTQILQDIVIAAAAVTGAIVAVAGLKTWKRQLRGRAEYELARRLLKAAYELRDSIVSFRRPMMWVEEMSAALAETGRAPDNLKGSRRAVYEVRWNAVLRPASDLKVGELEGEVLWGQSFKVAVAPLDKCLAQLSVALTEFLRYSEMADLAESQRAVLRKYEEVVYDQSKADDPDAFGKKLNQAIGALERFMRPKLRL